MCVFFQISKAILRGAIKSTTAETFGGSDKEVKTEEPKSSLALE
jgi:hypothetical protein